MDITSSITQIQTLAESAMGQVTTIMISLAPTLISVTLISVGIGLVLSYVRRAANSL